MLLFDLSQRVYMWLWSITAQCSLKRLTTAIFFSTFHLTSMDKENCSWFQTYQTKEAKRFAQENVC